MKVLTFLTDIGQSKGGPSRSVPLFVKGLTEVGVDITLMVIKSDDMNLHSLDGTTAKFHFLPKCYKISELESFIQKEGFDVIHGQCIWEPLFHHMRVIGDKYHIPFLLSPRGTLEPWCLNQKKWKKKIARWLYQNKDLRHCACIYATAEMEAKHVRELGFKNPISVIPNGIETSYYPCRHDPSGVEKQVLFLSRIHPKKGIEVLLSAWKNIHHKYPEWNLRIVGLGEEAYVHSLEQRIESMSLASSVRISPALFGDEKIAMYQKSSLFVLPSYSENFGMVIAEALSCGLPVITTDNTPWTLLNDSKTGWCISLNEENLTRALDEALSMDSEDLYRMGQEGSRVVYELFDYHSVAERNRDLYNWIYRGGDAPEFVQFVQNY